MTKTVIHDQDDCVNLIGSGAREDAVVQFFVMPF